MVSRRQRLNSVPPYRTIVSLRPRSRDSRLCCSGKSTGLILFYISICPYRQISIYLHIYISLLIPLILCGFSRGMASRWRSRNPGRLVEAKSFCFLLALLTLDGEKGCCLSGFVRFVGSLSVLFFGGTAGFFASQEGGGASKARESHWRGCEGDAAVSFPS